MVNSEADIAIFTKLLECRPIIGRPISSALVFLTEYGRNESILTIESSLSRAWLDSKMTKRDKHVYVDRVEFEAASQIMHSMFDKRGSGGSSILSTISGLTLLSSHP